MIQQTTTIMIHANTIKAAVKKQFPGVNIESIVRHKLGVFSVKVSKEMPRSKKIGFIFGETADLESAEMVTLDKKIDWIQLNHYSIMETFVLEIIEKELRSTDSLVYIDGMPHLQIGDKYYPLKAK